MAVNDDPALVSSKMRVACATTSHDVEEGECPWCTIERLTRESEAWDKASLVAIIADRDRLTVERDQLLTAIGEHVTVRSDQYAEIQRLRATLEKIAEFDCRPDEHVDDMKCWSCYANEALSGEPNSAPETGGEYARGRWEAMTEVAAWVDSRVEAEVTHRPDVNIYKRTLANTWGQMQRKLAELLGGEASRKPTADWSPSKTSETPWVAGPPTTAGSHVVHYESGYYAVLTLTPDSMVLRSGRDDNPYGIVRHFKFDSAQKAKGDEA